jgi:hypothetical protein
MAYMFHEASSFNCNVSLWNVSSATSMISMFYGASSFKSNISMWNVCGMLGV